MKLSFSCALLVLLLASCDGGDDAQRLSNLVTVASANYTSIRLRNGDAVVATDDTTTFSLSASTDEEGAAIVDIAGGIYSSSDNSIATVSNNGTVTGILDGTVTITARFGDLIDTADVRVSSAKLSSINITATDGVVELNECGSVQLSAFGVFAGEESQPRSLTNKAVWGVSPATAVFGTADGLLRATAPGVLKVTAGFDDVTGSFDIEVLDNLSSLTVAPSAGELAVGSPLQYSATAMYTDGSEADVTKNAVWDIADDNSSSGDFASVSNLITSKGRVTASRSGDGVLTASCGDVTSSDLLINSRGSDDVAEVIVASSNPYELIFSGEQSTIQLKAQSRNADGVVIDDITEEAEWFIFEENNDSNLILSNIDGSKGQITVTGRGEITLKFRYTDDDNNLFESSEYRVVSK